MTIRELMSGGLITVRRETPVLEARDLMVMIVRSALVVAVVLLAASVQAQDSGALAARGRVVFRDQGCYGCHTVGATGTPIATDLSRIGAKRDHAYLARWIRDPSLQRPTAHMPKIQLSEGEVEALAAYLGSLR